jgi:hypothetical protein
VGSGVAADEILVIPLVGKRNHRRLRSTTGVGAPASAATPDPARGPGNQVVIAIENARLVEDPRHARAGDPR